MPMKDYQDDILLMDRGLHYGDGLFETVRCQRGQIPLLDWHKNRLQHGLQVLQITLDTDQVWQDCLQLATELDFGVLKLLVTRGAGQRGYAPAADTPATVRILSFPDNAESASNLQNSWILRFCETPVTVNAVLAGLKTLNRLDSVLARMEWQDTSIDEGLLSDHDGNVIEGTRSNLFCVKDGCILTPLLDRAGVAGAMRQWILDHYDVEQVTLERKQLLAADELFVTNSLVGIMPVKQLEERDFSQDAPLTHSIQKSFEEFLS